MLRLIERLAWKLLLALSRRHEMHGFDVRIAGGVSDTVLLLNRLGDAFALIEQYDEDRMVEIRRVFRCILITDRAGGEFIEAVGACRLGRRYVTEAETLSLAMMIVHECKHAQLAEDGRRYTPDARGAIERECVDAEIEFAQRVPDSAEAIERARRLVASEWWNHDKHGRSMVDELNSRGVPRWLAEWSVKRAAKGRRGSSDIHF
jgi:hypothetical protein